MTYFLLFEKQIMTKTNIFNWKILNYTSLSFQYGRRHSIMVAIVSFSGFVRIYFEFFYDNFAQERPI